jgi:thioredoxin-related protein
LSQQLGNIINAVPFTVIVNQAGQIVHRQPGELSKQQFLDVLQPLLSKKQ